MDISETQKVLFFRNLQLLEFDIIAVETEYRVKCEKEMFSVPNQKMFEVVTHFLFEKLSDATGKEYNLPWPLIDREMHRQFLRITLNYLSNIAKESVIRFPTVVMSVISTFGGDRFYELYLAFSSHVVQRTIIKNNNVHLISPPSVSKHNIEDIGETLKILLVLSGEKLQQILNFSLKSLEHSLRTSNNFIIHIQKLKSTLANNSSLLKEKNAILASLYCKESDGEEGDMQYNMRKLLQHTKKIIKVWKRFSTFFKKEEIFFHSIYLAIQDFPEEYFLDGAQLTLDVDESMKELSPELNMLCAGQTQEEKVCILKYLKIYSTFLELYQTKLLKGDLTQVKELSNVNREWSLLSNVDELKTLNEKLTTVKLDLVEKNEVLKSLLPEVVPEDAQVFAKECPSWNFISKNFKDEINTNRSAFTDKLTDDLKTSLFADSGLESGTSNMENVASSSWSSASSSTRLKTYDDECISISSAVEPISVPIDELDSCMENINPSNYLQILKNKKVETENPPISNMILKNKKVETENPPISNMVQPSETSTIETDLPPSPLLNTQGLNFDIDLECYRSRRIRESWLTVESLDSVTLPETSILDETQ